MENKNNDLFSEMSYTDTHGNEITAGQKQQLDKQLNQAQCEKIESYIKEQESRSTNYLLGFAGALIGALLGAIPWGVVAAGGYFVGWLGFLVALLSSKGYDVCKVKTNKIKVICVIITSIIAVFAGQIISDIIFLKTNADFSPYFNENINYYFSNIGEMMSANTENILLGLLFVFLGGYTVIRDITKNNKLIKMYKGEKQDNEWKN